MLLPIRSIVCSHRLISAVILVPRLVSAPQLIATIDAHDTTSSHAPTAVAADERASFVTTLGRDTVAIESFTRSATMVQGDIVVRVPGTVLYHYNVDLAADGNVARAELDVKPMQGSDVSAYHVTVTPVRDSLVAQLTAGSQHRTSTIPRSSIPTLMVGSGASYGLYSSLGLYDLYLSRLGARTGDTVTVRNVDLGTARLGTRQFVRRAHDLIDVDYFNVGWTHLAIDAIGAIKSADASEETTERTHSVRSTSFIDAGEAANRFASIDRAHHGIGAASPNVIARGTIGGQLVVATYGSPRLRGRTVLGNVVPYNVIWRTGANEATVLLFDHALDIGGKELPGGAYSLWTRPHQDGTVELILNSQHGQWGTSHDPARDVAHIPMRVSHVTTPREDFDITITGTGNSGELRIAWDTFVWTVPIVTR